MATSENTPAKALGNFLDLITKVESNAGYMPSNASLLTPSMKILHADASTTLDTFHSSKAVMLASKKERARTVDIVKITSRRVVNFLKASGADDGKIEQAMAIYRMIHGYKAPGTTKVGEPVAAASAEETKKKSNKQGSQDSLVQNFQKLIHVLKTEPLYKPNEIELKITGLDALVTKFKADDLTTSTADAACEKARATLEKIFDDPKKGVKAVMSGVKLYSKAVYGAGSMEYKSVAKIKTPSLTF
jgi:hypothetical protein